MVIGSGAGGGAAAHELCRAGKRVLLVERGLEPDRRVGRDEQRMVIEKAAGDDRPLELNGHPGRLLTGGVLGGSTSLFGACLMRPSPEDFVPGRHYASHLPPHLHEWPLAYQELEPYLDRAEDLFGVSGDVARQGPHLGARRRPYAAPAQPFEPLSERLVSGLERQGMAPFPLPLAIDFETCLRCPSCPGFHCPNGARGGSLERLIEPMQREGRLAVWTGCEAESLVREGGRVRSVRIRRRGTDETEEIRAESFFVAAGAVGTPALLLRSGLEGESDQVGRNHMCHLGAAPIAIFLRATGAGRRFAKQVGLSDLYLGAPDFPHKLGVAQSIPVPGPLTVRKHAPFPLPMAVARRLPDRAVLFTGSIEDLPQPENRVTLRSDGGIRLERRFHAYDLFRARYLSKRLARLLRGCGAAFAIGHVAEDAHDHAAHQVGTCRFGRDPRHSVLDAGCRLHGHEGVYVVDGSFMPTSLGVGPALTIAANALRVASLAIKEMG
ncbi:MAG: GMC family oxidoreductase [Myxococcota bacterium]|nr:GMC family oxidoreductase [Myxococcota bacterium]